MWAPLEVSKWGQLQHSERIIVCIDVSKVVCTNWAAMREPSQISKLQLYAWFSDSLQTVWNSEEIHGRVGFILNHDTNLCQP